MALSISPARRMRVLSLAAMAAASLYVVMAFVAEPAGALADTQDVDVLVTIDATLSFTCGASSVNLGSHTLGSTSTGAVTCTPITNNSTGYSLKWVVSNGSGAAGARYGTGHLNSYIKNAANSNLPYQIKAFDPSESDGVKSTGGNLETPGTFTVASGDIRWAGRLASDSTTANAAAFGAENAKKFANVATGSVVTIATRTTQTTVTGDTEKVVFGVKSHNSAVTPATTYKTTVTLTVVNN